MKGDKKDLQQIYSTLRNKKDGTSEIYLLKDRINILEERFTKFGRGISQNAGSNENESDFDKLLLNQIRDDIDNLIKELDQIKELKRRILVLESTMEKKLDRNEFEKLKAENDINKLLKSMIKKFVDRNEMMKPLKKMDERITIIEELFREGGTTDNNEAAMLAKKPLGGWSCASCQKNLINLEGLSNQYYPWAKFPQRNPTERIAKIGQGFSRILAMAKTDQLNKTNYGGLVQKITHYESPSPEREDSERGRNSPARGISIETTVKRPSTADLHTLPEIQQNKVSILL